MIFNTVSQHAHALPDKGKDYFLDFAAFEYGYRINPRYRDRELYEISLYSEERLSMQKTSAKAQWKDGVSLMRWFCS